MKDPRNEREAHSCIDIAGTDRMAVIGKNFAKPLPRRVRAGQCACDAQDSPAVRLLADRDEADAVRSFHRMHADRQPRAGRWWIDWVLVAAIVTCAVGMLLIATGLWKP